MRNGPEIEGRAVALGQGSAAIPERLLLAHARGDVLFICGAGISKPSGLPDFRELVVDVYASIDTSVHSVLARIPEDETKDYRESVGDLTARQMAEVKRFIRRDYDIVLGMLERRMDGQTRGDSSVRREVARRLRSGAKSAAPIHAALVRLADRGGGTALVTTNFDLLLEDAARRHRKPLESYALGSIPRPSKKREFSGVFHIHGALDRNSSRLSELVLSDQDFGEFYLRRRVVPDFIYDAARLFHLVLVGYSANDPPMRYLFNAVAADGERFEDLKERFAFVGAATPDPVEMEEWKGRGITPIPYDSHDDHRVLHATLKRWSDLSAINGRMNVVDTELRRIVKSSCAATAEPDRDLFDHLFRRSNAKERLRLCALVSHAGADIDWLDSIVRIASERE